MGPERTWESARHQSPDRTECDRSANESNSLSGQVRQLNNRIISPHDQVFDSLAVRIGERDLSRPLPSWCKLGNYQVHRRARQDRLLSHLAVLSIESLFRTRSGGKPVNDEL